MHFLDNGILMGNRKKKWPQPKVKMPKWTGMHIDRMMKDLTLMMYEAEIGHFPG